MTVIVRILGPYAFLPKAYADILVTPSSKPTMEPMIAKLGNFRFALGEALQSYTALIGIEDEGINSNGNEEGRNKAPLRPRGG